MESSFSAAYCKAFPFSQTNASLASLTPEGSCLRSRLIYYGNQPWIPGKPWLSSADSMLQFIQNALHEDQRKQHWFMITCHNDSMLAWKNLWFSNEWPSQGFRTCILVLLLSMGNMLVTYVKHTPLYFSLNICLGLTVVSVGGHCCGIIDKNVESC